MKKLVYVLLGAVLGVAGTYFFSNQNPESAGANLKTAQQNVRLKGVISPKEAKALDVNFNTRHQLISDSIVGRPDNRSGLWALDDVRNYLDYAERQSDSLGYKMDGLRVYFGAYPEENGQQGYTTMFMVPTSDKHDIKEVEGLNKGFNGFPPSANYPQ